MTHAPLRIGCAAGFSGDRTDAAAPVVDALIAAGGPAVLIFETLAERTLALAQLARRSDPDAGYEPLLASACGPVLATACSTASASSATSAPPIRAARRSGSSALARELGLPAPRIAVVEGDDVSGPSTAQRCAERLRQPRSTGRDASSAPTPTSAPSRSPPRCEPARRSSSAAASPTRRLRWARRSRTSAGRATTGIGIGRATMAGHLLECGAQVTRWLLRRPGLQGRARPGARSAIPIAEIDDDGHCIDHQAAPARAAASTRTPSRSSCSTRCTTRRRT